MPNDCLVRDTGVACATPIPMQKEPSFLCSKKEAQSLLGLGPTKTQELINAGELESVKIGRRRLVVIASVHRLVERLMGRPAVASSPSIGTRWQQAYD